MRELSQPKRLKSKLEVGRDHQAYPLPLTYPQGECWKVRALWRAARQADTEFDDFFKLLPAGTGPRGG